MTQRAIWPVVTPARAAWLARLEREGIVNGRPRGATGFHCMRLGWSTWVFIKVADGPLSWENVRNIGETITDRGREALAAWRREHGET
jgi:DNA-binding PadR family transcriptional regulator